MQGEYLELFLDAYVDERLAAEARSLQAALASPVDSVLESALDVAAPWWRAEEPEQLHELYVLVRAALRAAKAGQYITPCDRKEANKSLSLAATATWQRTLADAQRPLVVADPGHLRQLQDTLNGETSSLYLANALEAESIALDETATLVGNWGRYYNKLQSTITPEGQAFSHSDVLARRLITQLLDYYSESELVAAGYQEVHQGGKRVFTLKDIEPVITNLATFPGRSFQLRAADRRAGSSRSTGPTRARGDGAAARLALHAGSGDAFAAWAGYSPDSGAWDAQASDQDSAGGAAVLWQDGRGVAAAGDGSRGRPAFAPRRPGGQRPQHTPCPHCDMPHGSNGVCIYQEALRGNGAIVASLPEALKQLYPFYLAVVAQQARRGKRDVLLGADDMLQLARNHKDWPKGTPPQWLLTGIQGRADRARAATGHQQGARGGSTGLAGGATGHSSAGRTLYAAAPETLAASFLADGGASGPLDDVFAGYDAAQDGLWEPGVCRLEPEGPVSQPGTCAVSALAMDGVETGPRRSSRVAAGSAVEAARAQPGAPGRPFHSVEPFGMHAPPGGAASAGDAGAPWAPWRHGGCG